MRSVYDEAMRQFKSRHFVLPLKGKGHRYLLTVSTETKYANMSNSYERVFLEEPHEVQGPIFYRSDPASSMYVATYTLLSYRTQRMGLHVDITGPAHGGQLDRPRYSSRRFGFSDKCSSTRRHKMC